MYAYPPSPDDSDDDYPPAHAATLPFSARLRFLQQELVTLEAEVAKSNVHSSEKEKKKDAGQMIDGLKDIKSRLEMIGKTRGKEGRGRLVEAIQSSGSRDAGLSHSRGPSLGGRKDEKEREREKEIAELDRRLGELERLVGSSSAALDEVSGKRVMQGGLRLLIYCFVSKSSPLPPPLLPMFTRLNTQLTVLTQPRTIDAISRRLKLLLTDLDKLSAHPAGASAARAAASGLPQANGYAPPPSTSTSGPNPAGLTPASQLQSELTPILQRLAPHLPSIPHILTRLRTLSSLHAAAAEFQRTLSAVENEQVNQRSGMDELLRAIEKLEDSVSENGEVARRNVEGLEGRIAGLEQRLQDLHE